MIKAVLQYFTSRSKEIETNDQHILDRAERIYNDALQAALHATRQALACGILIPIPGDKFTGFLYDPYGKDDREKVFSVRLAEVVAMQAHSEILQTYANHVQNLDFDDAFERYTSRAAENAIDYLPNTTEAADSIFHACSGFADAEFELKTTLQVAADTAKAYAETL